LGSGNTVPVLPCRAAHFAAPCDMMRLTESARIARTAYDQTANNHGH
jgi:hypothetical protein